MDSDESRPTSFITDSNDANQPFPASYRSELVAFLHTYLNNPVDVHDASVAEPVQRTVGGRVRYVACVRFAERQSDGGYREPRERAVVFVGGRLDRMAQNTGEACAGAVYAAFPDLEKMTRQPRERVDPGVDFLAETAITFRRGLNWRARFPDLSTGGNRLYSRQNFPTEGTKSRCCQLAAVKAHHGSGIAAGQPN